MRRSLLSCFAVVSILLLQLPAFAQAGPDAGIQPFSTNVGGPIDSIDLATSNVLIHVPVRTKTGKIPFSYSLMGNSGVYIYSGTWLGEFFTLPGEPMIGVFGSSLGGKISSVSCGASSNNKWASIYSVDPTGATHSFPGSYQSGPGGCSVAYSQAASDGSGFTLVIPASSTSFTNLNTSGYSLYDKAGNKASASTGTLTLTDPDGVTMKAVSQTGTTTYTDTLGATALTATYNGPSGGPDTYTYKDASGTTQEFSVSYIWEAHIQTNFGCSGVSDFQNSFYLPTAITTPTGGQYTIAYEQTPGYGSGYTTGRVSQITLPSGGYVSYGYSGGSNNAGINCTSGVVPTLTRTINDNNGNVGTWTYVNSNANSPSTCAAGAGPCNYTVTETDPAGNQTVHYFSGEYQTQAVYHQGTSTVLKTVTTCYNGMSTNCASPSTVPALPITQTDVYTSLGTSKSNHIQTLLDIYGNVGQVLAYDFGGTTPIYQQDNYYGQSYAGNYVCNAYPSGTYIRNTSCFSFVNGVSQEQVVYSNTGHPTSTSRWVGGSNPWLTSSAAYGTNGAAPGVLSSVTDANGGITSFGNFACNGMLPGSTTYPLPSVGSSSQTWDCNGGVVTSTKDVNGQTTSYSYTTGGADPLYRLKFITRPDGGSDNLSYSTGSGAWTTNDWTQTNATQGGGTTYAYDGLGRVVATYSTDPNTSSGQRTGLTVFNALGQVSEVYNPYFTSSDQTYGYTAYTYDALGRLTSATAPSGLTSAYTYTNRAVKVVQFPSFNGFTKVYQEDGLGRLVDVCEVTSAPTYNKVTPYSCNLDTPATGFLSTITYDALGNVLTMNRDDSSEQKSMTYDGLSRLLSVTTSEAGTTNYVYDTGSKGDLFTESRPLPNQSSGTETVTYSWDAMHRLTQKSYSDGVTPTVQYSYDQATAPSVYGSVALSNPKGRLSWETYSATYPDLVFGYDPVGRVAQFGQCVSTGYCGTIAFLNTYTYDYRGDVLGGNNISNNVGWTNTYNEIGQLTQVHISNLDGQGHAGNVVTNLTYNALSQPVSDSLGDGDNESWSYSKDGVLTNYSAGSGPTYDFNLTVNTGVISASNTNQYAGTSYTYDAFGRLSTQGQTGTGGSGVVYGYDQYGNRWSEAPTKGSPPTSSFGFSSTSPSIPPTNRILGGVTYDAAGNMTYDGRYYYTYDGNNRVLAVGTAPGGSQVASYAYNTRGWRYQTTVSGTTVDWLYSLYGEQLTAEIPGTTQVYGTELFVGGRDWGAGNPNGLNFRYADWVGNGQVWKDVAGTVTQQEAYWGFGDGIFAPGGGSCCNFAFQFDDAIADASGTFHTPNREYVPSQGRWLTPDPAGLAAVDLTNPQTWNRYAYVTNNPVSYIDPTGLNLSPFRGGCDSDQSDCGSSGGSPSSPGGDSSGGINIVGGPGLVGFSQSFSVYGWVNTGDGPFQWQQFATLTFPQGAAWIVGGTSPGGDSSGQTGGGPANNGQQPNPSKKNSPACQQAQAQLSSIGNQLSMLDSSLRQDYFKNQLAAAGVGCVYGMASGEAVETPAIGTPAAVGNCAVGALGGVAVNNVQYIITNLGSLGAEISMMGQEAKAIANVINACY